MAILVVFSMVLVADKNVHKMHLQCKSTVDTLKIHLNLAIFTKSLGFGGPSKKEAEKSIFWLFLRFYSGFEKNIKKSLISDGDFVRFETYGPRNRSISIDIARKSSISMASHKGLENRTNRRKSHEIEQNAIWCKMVNSHYLA